MSTIASHQRPNMYQTSSFHNRVPSDTEIIVVDGHSNARGKDLDSLLRQTDLIGRYGGEEFIIMLLDTSPEEGVRTAEKLRVAIESASFSGGDKQPGGKVTASLGAAFFPADATTEHELIDCADRALYLSKEKGRNSVSTWSEVISERS